jgi:hypothetical protein
LRREHRLLVLEIEGSLAILIGHGVLNEIVHINILHSILISTKHLLKGRLVTIEISYLAVLCIEILSKPISKVLLKLGIEFCFMSGVSFLTEFSINVF